MLSYLLEDDERKIAADLRQLISDAHQKDIDFQFWELFLNSGIRRVHDNPRRQASHDRLLISYHTFKNDNGQFKIEKTSRILHKEKDSHIKSYSDVLDDIRYLHSMCYAYQMNGGYEGEICFKYEAFRFFVVNTIINYFIDDEAYGFRNNGVAKFLDELISNNPSLKATTLGKFDDGADAGSMSLDLKNEIRSEYFDASGMKIDKYINLDLSHLADRSSNRYKVANFLKSIAQNANSITGLVIANFGSMSLSCMRIFFNDSINVYLPWMPAGSSGFLGKEISEPSFVVPAKELKTHEGLIYHSINWRSYSTYNRIAGNRTPLSSGEEGRNTENDIDRLGVMHRWPILQGIRHDGPDSEGIFQIGGFLRMMRRYSSLNQKLVEPDDYTPKIWDSDQAILKPLVARLSKNIGRYLSYLD